MASPQVTSFGTPAMARSTSGSTGVTGSWGTGQNRTAGHQLVALVSAGGSSASAAAISTPAGWAQQAVIGNTASSANAWVAVYTKTAAGSDSAPSFTSTLSGTQAMTCTLLELAAAADLFPVDTSGTYSSGGSSGTLSAMTATTGGIVSVAGEYAVTVFCQEAAAATNTWNAGSGGWANLANDGATSSVLHTAVDSLANPAALATATETAHWTTDTSAFGAGIIVVFAVQGGGLPTFGNDLSTTISSGGTGAPAAGTAELWTASSWSGFTASPTTTPPTVTYLADPAAPSELVALVNSSTGLVVRGVQGTTPVSHSGGFTVNQVFPAGMGLTRWYNVRDPQFGATGNGTTDDTAAINAAVTACGTAGGGVVYLPAGTYACTGAVNVNYSNVTLLGDGWGNATSLTYISGTSRAAAIVVGVTAPVANSNVIGLAVNSGAGGTIQSGSGHGIVFRSEIGLIRDVTVTYPDGDGLHLSMDALTPAQIYDVTMFNNYVSFANNDCVYVDTNYYNCEFTVVKCQGGGQAGSPFGANGFNIQGTEIKFITCHAYYQANYGMIIGNGAGSSDITVIGGEYENNNYGGIFVDGNGGTVTQVKIIGADFYGQNPAYVDDTPYGVMDICVFNVNGMTVQDCLLTSDLAGSVANILIASSSGVIVADNSVNNTSSPVGIQLGTYTGSAGADVNIHHNYVNTSTGTPGQSIVLSDCTYCDAAYNTVSAGVSESQGNGTANYNRIYGNIYTGGSGNSQFTVTGANSVAWGNTGTGASSTSQVQQSGYGATATIGSTTAETLLVSIPVPAGEPVTGAVYALSGYATTVIGSTAPTVTWRTRWGGTTGTVLAVTGAIAETVSTTGIWQFDSTVTFASGTSATAAMKVAYTTGSVSESPGRYGTATTGIAVNTTPTAVTVTSAENLVLTAAFSAANGQTLTAYGHAERIA